MSTQNHLIEILPRGDRRRLLELCEPVALVLGKVICEPATPTRHVYFPIDGFISLVAVVAGKPGVEVGMVGREGMLGSQLALGVRQSPLHAVVQGAGSALRIGKVAFRAELVQNLPLQRAIEVHRRSHGAVGDIGSVLALLRDRSATSALALDGPGPGSQRHF